MHTTLPGQTLVPGQTYPHYKSPTVQFDNSGTGMETLADSLGKFNLRGPAPVRQDNISNASMQAKSVSVNSMMGPKAENQVLYQLQDGTFVYSGTNSNQAQYQQYANNYNLAVPGSSQYQQAGYNPMAPNGIPNGPSTPRGQAWMPSQGVAQVPELVAPRRSSWSSNEEASPQTPAFGGWQQPVFVPGHSPTDWSTPSPMSAQLPYFHHFAKSANGEPVIVDFWEWTHREPAIPEPVPARHSGPDGGRGSLDKILDNRDGTTNVYVRGLQPDTTDELLGLYGQRFGPIVSQKAIIDHSNGTCKGFGFIKYNNYIDAENCIRGFFHRGYEAKFARQSHNSRLKQLADESNTNLYVSNLPKLINEDELKGIFASVYPPETFPQYRAGSCKILKDSCGISRGVGFARFETPEICEQIINTFNNKTIGEGKDATTLQIRYADTEQQKALKNFTAVKRQFKADEYNEAVYGIPFTNYSPISAPYQSPLQARAPGINGPWINQSPASSISPSSFGSYPHSVLRARQSSSGLNPAAFVKPDVGFAIPNMTGESTRIKIESPSVVAAAKKAAAETVEDVSTDGGSSSKSDEGTLAEKSKSAKVCITDVDFSPTKSKL